MKVFRFLWLMVGILGFAVAEASAQEVQVDVEMLRSYAEQGHLEAQYELGVRLIEGDLVEKDLEQAARWLKAAADRSHPGAMNALGSLYEQGLGVAKDEKRGFELYLASAQAGFVLGQYNVSECYDRGKGVEKNEKESQRWLLAAALQDFAPAQALYGWALEEGTRGMKKNPSEAALWHLRAAHNGHAPAVTHMGYLYFLGKGVPRDFRRADAWYRRAMRSNDPWAKNDYAWFLSVCPDVRFHDAELAVELAQEALKEIGTRPYQVVDTLAAAYARQGKFGEAVQHQIQALTLLNQAEVKPEAEAEIKKLDEELKGRLNQYRQQQAFQEALSQPAESHPPLIEDRILQEEPRSRPRRFQEPGREEKPAPRVSDGGDSVV